MTEVNIKHSPLEEKSDEWLGEELEKAQMSASSYSLEELNEAIGKKHEMASSLDQQPTVNEVNSIRVIRERRQQVRQTDSLMRSRMGRSWGARTK